jgi:hypothetical protein
MASPNSNSHQQGLPSISSLTNGLPPSNAAQQYSHGDQPQGEHLRDSGTWPQPHSKRECLLRLFPCVSFISAGLVQHRDCRAFHHLEQSHLALICSIANVGVALMAEAQAFFFMILISLISRIHSLTLFLRQFSQ